MIVWIDGTFGVGKSSVAENLQVLLNKPDVVVLDSDPFYLSGLKILRYFGGGILPQNNARFLSDFKAAIEKEITNNISIIIVVMALTMDECRDTLLFPLQNQYSDLLHIVLTASRETIVSRIEGDSGRDYSFAQTPLSRNMAYLQLNYPHAEWINAESITPKEAALKIIELIDKHSASAFDSQS